DCVLRNAAFSPQPSSEVGAGGLAEVQRVTPPRPLDFAEYRPPRALYRWSILGSSEHQRLDDLELRSFVVQYNESDFDFVSRLLEEEGIAYYFEEDANGLVMTLEDGPGQRPASADDDVFSYTPAAGLVDVDHEFVESFRRGFRLR